MHALLVPAIAALLPSLASAGFSNTHALLAWSDSAQSNLESFRPFAATASQAYAIQQAEAAGEECYPALVVSAPSFKNDDLELLAAGSTIRREWTTSPATLHVPYVSTGQVEPLKNLVARRLAHCNDQPIVFRKMRDYAKGLQSTRTAWVNELDRLVAGGLEHLPSNRIVILSSVPDVGAHYRQKRQISKEEWSELETSSSDIGVTDPTDVDSASDLPKSIFAEDNLGSSAADDRNSTVDPNSGVFFRYSFTSPALIFGTLVMLIVLIPAVLLSVNAITSIERLQGLETKMQGGSTGESKKDQ